ncbi:PepSY domain-containing protein [Herbaspirillum sp. AP02]|uniref:PepSY domain-containing protein n=1 Tax=unclassified Herbaspirillum TaxID=2624150 RepID=UPI0015DA25C1|nr:MULTISPECIES: PepSY domain-containing protein [unclassified Herbaspirillum]MBG7618929.1 PepSY domain-containing protein [Herbaspirillum sp. AP02]NZD67269.1 PepSY domain-containing protein [Herbaspirillum sp. AP21]
MVATSWPARLRRWTYLTHRWCGVAGCLLMALWFASGVVMLFVGYPKLTPWDRLAALPALEAGSKLQGPPPQARAGALVLNAASGQPRYLLRREDGSLLSLDAASGAAQAQFDRDAALRAARLFRPGAEAHYLGQLHEDRWTHARSLDAHRPMHQIMLDDAAHTLVYVSSHSGEVVMQATRLQRGWNYVGAWLHWLYVFKDQPVDPVWTWTVIALSAGCVLVACSGIVVGLWRWRFGRPYKSGSHSPFTPGWMRWHHLLGLGFAAITLTWIFSGLMSMNPLGIFSAAQRPDLARYAAVPAQGGLLAAPTDAILQSLAESGFRPVELEWLTLAGQPFVLARDAHDGTRLVLAADAQGQRLLVAQHWSRATLEQAGTRLMSAPLVAVERMDHYDAYYYRRDSEAMMGGAQRQLPVLRLRFADAGHTLVYLNLQSGQVEMSADRAQRIGRWLFSLLHSWDLGPMLAAGWLREAVLILLSLGGLALSGSGVVIGWRRLRRKFGARA